MTIQVRLFFLSISILLLAEGRTAYMGSRADAIEYFERQVSLKVKKFPQKDAFSS